MKTLVLNTFGLHLGYLGCYGNDWIATPNLDRLASESIVFDQHFVDVPTVVAPSNDDWLTARRSLDRLDGADVLRLNGPSFAAPWTIPDDVLTSYTEDDEVEPWLDPPSELTDDESILRVQDTYAAAVTWFDAQFGRFLADVDSRRWANDLLLVFTASSGYPLGEHGRLGWNLQPLHEELVHVPLIVRCPGRRCAGDRIGAITQPADVEIALRDWSSGAGIASLIRGVRDAIRPCAITRWQSESSIRTPEWALLLSDDSKRQLYVKPDDRWEVNDLAEREYERADELERLLRNGERGPSAG